MRFTPSVYEHAAALVGMSPLRVSRDGDLLFQAHAEAFRRYGHAPVTVGIDIYNLEAEAYGAGLDAPAGNGIPTICRHLGAEVADLLRLGPLDVRSGRIPMVLEAGRRLARSFPAADVRIPVSGPFSLAGNLIGFDALLCGLMDDPDAVRTALLHLAEGQVRLCREIVANGLGIALFESGATPPLLSPERFASVELPVLKRVVAGASAAAGRPVPCVIGGNTAPILDSLLETGAGYVICPAETDQARFMRDMRAHPGVMVRVNMRAAVFAAGAAAALRGEFARCAALAAGREKVCIGSGGLPYDANPERVLLAAALARGETG